MSTDIKNIVITSAVRSAIGTFRGSLKEMQASDFGTLVVKAAIEKSNLNFSEANEVFQQISPRYKNIKRTIH